MYWTKLIVTGLTEIDLPIVGASPTDPYILKEVDGLGPPDVDVYISNTINQGGLYQARRPQNREIVMRVGLNPDYGSGQTVSDLRVALYGLLTPGGDDTVTVGIADGDTVLMYTAAYVKKFEMVPFSKDPEVQITLSCPASYFQGDPITVDTTSMDKANPVINNPGSAPTGFLFKITMTGSEAGLVVQNENGNYIFISSSLTSGDVVSFNTDAGQRGAWIDSGGGPESALISLTEPVTWLQLHAGDNDLNTGITDFTFTEISFVPKFWGV